MLKSLQKKREIFVSGFIHKLRHSPRVTGRDLLIVHLDHLGDVCTLIPSVYPLLNTYSISVVCKPGMEFVWKEFLPSIRVMPLQNAVWYSEHLIEELSTLLSMHYKAVVVPTITPYAAFLSSLATAEMRIGLIEGGRFFKGSRILYDRVYNAPKHEHVCTRFPKLFAMVDGTCRKPENPPLRNAVLPKPMVLLHPGGKWKPRRWPAERFLEVAQQISANDVACAILIHESEQELQTFFAGIIHNRKITLTLTRNAEDLVAAVRSCSLFIGNDSGPAHLANLLGKETIILWGPGNYDRIHPLGKNNDIIIKPTVCRPCRQYQDGENCRNGENVCLLAIEVEDVMERVALKTLKP